MNLCWINKTHYFLPLRPPTLFFCCMKISIEDANVCSVGPNIKIYFCVSKHHVLTASLFLGLQWMDKWIDLKLPLKQQCPSWPDSFILWSPKFFHTVVSQIFRKYKIERKHAFCGFFPKKHDRQTTHYWNSLKQIKEEFRITLQKCKFCLVKILTIRRTCFVHRWTQQQHNVIFNAPFQMKDVLWSFFFTEKDKIWK